MAVIVAVMGESGTGKTTSLRNFKQGEASVVNVSKKPLPFRNTLSVLKTDNYQDIQTILTRAQAKSIIIDDAQYLMAFEYMHRAKETGYEKFTDIGANFFNLTQTAVALPDDKIIYFLFHVERTKDGNEKCKTIGQLLDEKITLEGLFTIVLKTVVILSASTQHQFYFATVNNGRDTVKAPMGMFEDTLIPNELLIRLSANITECLKMFLRRQLLTPCRKRQSSEIHKIEMCRRKALKISNHLF